MDGTGGSIAEGSGGAPEIGSGGSSGSGGESGSGGVIGTGGGSGGSIMGSGGGNGVDGSTDMTVDIPGSGGAGGGLSCAGVAEWSVAATPSYLPAVNGQPGTRIKHGNPSHLFRCKPNPEGFWCQEPSYEPLAPSGYWRDAWDDLGACN